MTREFKIERVKNGIILTDNEGEKSVFDGDAHRDFADFLCYLSGEYGPSDTRYSPERIYIVVGPGDKNDKYVCCPFCHKERQYIESESDDS